MMKYFFITAYAILLFALTQTTPVSALECVRMATDADRRVLGNAVVVGETCIDAATENTLRLTDTSAAIAFLESRVCNGEGGTQNMAAGLPAETDTTSRSPLLWSRIKETRVYFTAGNTSMDPGALRCFANFIKAAENQGFRPCISAGLRAPAHQMASCLDAGNTVVCGRSGRGTGPVSSCPRDPSGYTKCPHVNGLAIDINEKTGKLDALLDLARRSGQFSKVGAGAADPWHIEARNCATGNSNLTAPIPTQPAQSAAPGNGIVSRLLSGFTGGNQCQQLSTQCTSGNSAACMQYVQQCSQGQNPTAPSLPTLPTGSSQGTSGISTAYTTPPQQETVTVTPPAQTSPATTTTSTTTSTTSIHILEQIAVSTDIATTTATTSRPLGTTTITLLTQEQARLSDTTNTVSVPSTGTTNVLLPSLPSDSTFTSPTPTETGVQSTFLAARTLSLLAEAQRILENLLLFVQPFSLTRYEATSDEYTEEDFLHALEDLEATLPATE